jgi:hypothetical protein
LVTSRGAVPPIVTVPPDILRSVAVDAAVTVTVTDEPLIVRFVIVELCTKRVELPLMFTLVIVEETLLGSQKSTSAPLPKFNVSKTRGSATPEKPTLALLTVAVSAGFSPG